MMSKTLIQRLAGVMMVAALAACGDPLEVNSPTLLRDSDVQTARAAELLYADVVIGFGDYMRDGVIPSGLVSDEFFSDARNTGTPEPETLLDRRDGSAYVARVVPIGGEQYSVAANLRFRTMAAMFKQKAYVTNTAHLGELYAIRGFLALRLAEDYCGGFPLNEIDAHYAMVYKPPFTTEQVLERALADFDSAATYGRDSARVLNFAWLGRARTYLALGRFAEASAAAAHVADDYVRTGNYGQAFGRFGERNKSVSDREGSIGLDFVSANDPRVPTTLLGAGDATSATMYDFAPYTGAPYGQGKTPVIVASGLEARLIAAEAALHEHASDGEWLTILNDLRATRISPAMAALADPVTPAERVDLLFRERAFWLFATGHRLGDLRRLIGQYGRPSESVFPTGAYHGGGAYGAATNIWFPAPLEQKFNAAVTGCLAGA